MKDRSHMIKALGIIILCAMAAALYMLLARTIHENTANKHWNSKRYLQRVSNPANILMVDSCIELLQTGDLVLRRGDDMTSYMLSKLNLRDKTWSHCGLVLIENGKPYVYHSIGGEDNPDEKMKRETATQWFSPANNHAFAVYRYDLNDTTIEKLTTQLHTYYNERVMFDMDFDLNTDDRLYCSEMIYKAINRATGDNTYIKTQHSYARDIVGIDNLFLNPHAARVCQVRFK